MKFVTGLQASLRGTPSSFSETSSQLERRGSVLGYPSHVGDVRGSAYDQVKGYCDEAPELSGFAYE